jgi:hypothetical protein
MGAVVIPAAGTVDFLVFNMGDDYPTRLAIDGVEIEGQVEWTRPVVGLVFRSTYDGPASPFTARRDGDSLFALPLVVDEIGSIYELHDYLHNVVGSSHWECTAHFYRPHISGPVSDAPRVRERPAAEQFQP